MNQIEISDGMLERIRSAAPWVSRVEVGPPLGAPHGTIGTAHTVQQPGRFGTEIWVPYQLTPDELERVAAGAPVWFVQHGGVNPMSAAVDPWGVELADVAPPA